MRLRRAAIRRYFGSHSLRRRHVDIGDRDDSTGLGKRMGRRFADPRSAAGNDRNSAIEPALIS